MIKNLTEYEINILKNAIDGKFFYILGHDQYPGRFVKGKTALEGEIYLESVESLYKNEYLKLEEMEIPQRFYLTAKAFDLLPII